MHIDCLKTLVETVRMGSFSKAAENLFVTQSTVSRRIQLLEEHYGVQLLNRISPILVPTDAGKIALERFNEILTIERELAQRILELKDNPGVSFCCTPAFGIAYLPDIMKRFILSHSTVAGIKFFFELPDKVLEGLRSGVYQAGIIEHFEPYDYSGFDLFTLPEDELVFVSSPQLEIPKKTKLDQLFKYDFYVRMEGCCSNRLLLHNLKNMGRNKAEFARTIVCADLHLIIDTVLEGNGITFVSRSLVEQHVMNGKLKIHRLPGFKHFQQRTMVVSRACSAPLLHDFIKEIQAVFGEG
jgi:DNA-binding transcriptional LysR family regulator